MIPEPHFEQSHDHDINLLSEHVQPGSVCDLTLVECQHHLGQSHLKKIFYLLIDEATFLILAAVFMGLMSFDYFFLFLFHFYFI